MFSLALLIVFLVAMVVIGIWGMKRTKNLGDFFLGGRSLGPWMSAFAYGTTYFSAVIFIGFAGKIGWAFGLKGLWIAFGNAVFGSLLAWLVLGRRTRRMTQNLDAMTMPEFFHERFQGKYIKMITAVIIFVFLTPYSASVFKGLGYLFQATFGISFDVALLIMILITGIYLILGGYFAVALTDFIQGLIMLGGCVVMVGVLVNHAGGCYGLLGHIAEKYAQHVPAAKQPNWLMLGSLVFMTSFGTWGMPQMVQKFYAIKNEKMIMRGAIISLLFAVVITFAAYFTGALAHLFMDAPVMANGKPAFDQIIPNLLHTNLPEPLMAVILLLVLSASMSTLSSLVLVSASAISIDLYKGHVNPNVTKEDSLMMMRFLSGVFIVISYFIARYEFAFIVTLMAMSWGVIAGAFMAPFLYGLYWKGTTKIGVKAGMAVGVLINIVAFCLLGKDKYQANSTIVASSAMLVPFIVVPLVSLFTKPPQKALLDKAFDKI